LPSTGGLIDYPALFYGISHIRKGANPARRVAVQNYDIHDETLCDAPKPFRLAKFLGGRGQLDSRLIGIPYATNKD
jgi:hypothetical protein